MKNHMNQTGAKARARTAGLICIIMTATLLAACGNSSSTKGATETTVQPSVSAAAASQSPAASPAAPQTVTDELGHELVIPASPQKIYAPYLEDSLLKLGVKPVAQWSSANRGQDYLQDQLKGVPGLDFTAAVPPSPEALMAYEPDLIILQSSTYSQNGVYENYSKIAPTYVFKNASADVAKSLSILGDLLGKSAEADKAVQDYRKKTEDAKAKLAAATQGKNVAIIRFNDAKGISLMGGNYLCGYVLYQELGLGKPKLVATENAATVSLEVLPEIDADYIFLLTAQGTTKLREMEKSAVWQTMPAVKAGQVYEIPDEYWLGSGFIAYEKIIEDTLKKIVK
jgi:iron complex transport system substrate-binding protein